MNDYLNSARYFDSLHSKVPPDELRFYRKYTRRRSQVLDVGCGTGRISLELARTTSKCTFDCIDISEQMLSIFLEKKIKLDASTYTYGRSIKIVNADMRTYATDKMYNLIMFSGQSIQTIPSRQGIVDCILHLKSMLTNDGRIILTGFDPRIGRPDSCIEKINGFGADKDKLFMSFLQKIEIDGEEYRYTEITKVYGLKHGFLIDETSDDFRVCAVDREFVQSLSEKLSRRTLN